MRKKVGKYKVDVKIESAEFPTFRDPETVFFFQYSSLETIKQLYFPFLSSSCKTLYSIHEIKNYAFFVCQNYGLAFAEKTIYL